MPRSYLKYEAKGMTGVVVANEGNIVVAGVGEEKRQVVCTPSLENVHIFDMETMSIVGFIPGGSDEAAVSCLECSADGEQLLIGYTDGHVSIYLTADWDTLMVRGLGHKLNSKILSLASSADTTMVASGGSDTDIVIWDVSTQDPVFRLRGHKSAILGLKFQQNHKKLISVAGDGLVKVWEPEIRACIHTFIGSSSQATSICMDISESRLIVGARDNILKVYDLENTTGTAEEAYTPHGTLERQNHRPVAMMKYNPSHTLLAVQSADRVIELYQVLSEKGVGSKLARQKKRRREKDKDTDNIERHAGMEYHRLDSVIRCEGKIRSFDFIPRKEAELNDEPDRLVAALNDNQLEVWDITWTDSKVTPVTVMRAKECGDIGHRGEVRASTMSASNRLVATCATGGVKVWRIELEEEGEEGAIVDCTHTIDIPEAVCLAFLPGDQHIVAGTKEGTLELINLPNSEVIESFEAHEGEVQAVCLRADGKGIASGGKDKKMKIWSFDLVQQEETKEKHLTLFESSTLEFTDAITAITYSQDKKFFAAALQDNTVKVYFADSCKFFLSLFGHKYPVTSLSISDDSRLIATGSIDKNVKLWGLDFGDCHKSLYAHDDYVTDVKFVGGTHYLWTTGKDGTVKCWDADHFTHIQTLRGHHGAVWGCELSKEGGILISYGGDRTLRSWVRTEGLLFPEEEAEKEAQQAADKEAAASLAYAALDKADAEVGVAGQRTALHLKGSEDLVEALDLAMAELERRTEGGVNAETKHPLLGSLTPLQYLGKVVEGIKGHAMRYVLSGVPVDYSKRLLSFCVDLLKEKCCRVEAVAKVAMFLIKQFSQELQANPSLKATTLELSERLSKALAHQVDTHGFNNSGLNLLTNHISSRQAAGESFFDVSNIKGHKKARK